METGGIDPTTGTVRPTDTPPEGRLTLAEIVRLDMRRYGARFVRAEFAFGALLAAAVALPPLAAVAAHRQMAPVGRVVLLGLGLCFAGWLLNSLTLLVLACRQDAGPARPDDPHLAHRAIWRLLRLVLVPGSLPLLALRQGYRSRRTAPSRRTRRIRAEREQ